MDCTPSLLTASSAPRASMLVARASSLGTSTAIEETIRHRGIRWNVRRMGSGGRPVLLLVHGTGASSLSFREIMPLLAERFDIVAPDLPGHGDTLAPSWFTPSLPSVAASLEELLREMKLMPTVCVGHSAGAAVLTRMVIDRTLDPTLLVGLAAALVPFHGVAAALLRPMARILARTSKVVGLRIRNTDTVARLLRSTGSELDARGVETYRALTSRPSHVTGTLSMMASWDLEPLSEALPNLRVPLLLLAGSHDRAVRVEEHEQTMRRLAHAKPKLLVVEGAGHLLHEERPAEVARLIFEETDVLTRGQR